MTWPIPRHIATVWGAGYQFDCSIFLVFRIAFARVHGSDDDDVRVVELHPKLIGLRRRGRPCHARRRRLWWFVDAVGREAAHDDGSQSDDPCEIG
jgi:hypothetical protein